MVTAASRSAAAARLLERRVRDDRTLPPEILLLGARLSHDVKCLAVGQAERAVPHSLTSLSANAAPIPWIWVRSTPRSAWSATRASKAGAFGCFVVWRAGGSLPIGLPLSADRGPL